MGAEALRFYGVSCSPTTHIESVARRFRSETNHQQESVDVLWSGEFCHRSVS